MNSALGHAKAAAKTPYALNTPASIQYPARSSSGPVTVLNVKPMSTTTEPAQRPRKYT